jgi:hypothetical protein
MCVGNASSPVAATHAASSAVGSAEVRGQNMYAWDGAPALARRLCRCDAIATKLQAPGSWRSLGTAHTQSRQHWRFVLEASGALVFLVFTLPIAL